MMLTERAKPHTSDIRVAALDHFLAPIRPFLADPTVSEVMINGPSCIYVEREGRIHPTDARFESDSALWAAARNIAEFVGIHPSLKEPRIDARLPDGSRVHIVLPPCSRNGISIAIRRFSKKVFTPARLIELGVLTPQAGEFLELCVLLRKNIIVSGGTGSGKTSFLNALSCFVPDDERIITIEDVAELKLNQEHVVSLEARPPDRYGEGAITIRDLFLSSLRMRPDRIIVGECRSGETLDMLQAMTSGHEGSMSTVHANHPRDALSRIETMAMMSAVQIPLAALRSQVASGVHLIVHTTRFADGSRGVMQISEVLPLDAQGAYQLTDLFKCRRERHAGVDRVVRTLVPTGSSPTFKEQALALGLTDRIQLNRSLFDMTSAEG